MQIVKKLIIDIIITCNCVYRLQKLNFNGIFIKTNMKKVILKTILRLEDLVNFMDEIIHALEMNELKKLHFQKSLKNFLIFSHFFITNSVYIQQVKTHFVKNYTIPNSR